jgi:hypothetical protein
LLERPTEHLASEPCDVARVVDQWALTVCEDESRLVWIQAVAQELLDLGFVQRRNLDHLGEERVGGWAA